MTERFSKRGGAFIISAILILIGAAVVSAAPAREARNQPNRASRLATITGTVQDAQGNPLEGAIISLLREGAERVVKETRSAKDGSFIARVSSGRYLLRAVAEGFNAATTQVIQVRPTEQINYGFKLEPVGQGRTLPERRRSRDDEKYSLRAAHINRPIFEYDGNDAAAKTQTASVAVDQIPDAANDETDPINALPEANKRAMPQRAHGFIETYAASNNALASNYVGTNFAIETPVNDKLGLIFAGQLGNAPLRRLQVTARERIGERHRLGLTFDGAQFNYANNFINASTSGALTPTTANAPLGQVAVRAIDEWVVRDGVVLVLGLDYSRFTGGRHYGASVSPRLGVQFDANARTRLRAAYTPHGARDEAQSVAEFEETTIVFPEPTEQPLAFIGGRAALEKSQRFEFGIERVLDNSSSIEATSFFDTTDGRGVGLLSLPLSGLAVDEDVSPQLAQVVSQQGGARGVRVVYARRLNRYLNASAGYAFGRGQELAPQAAALLSDAASRPDQIFRNAAFQTLAAQLDADWRTGTRIRAVLRFSPRAAVFAIDPFAGRLAVYDPSLSIIVTQELPTFGLPVRATAIIDARNLLDSQPNNDDGEMLTALNLLRRSVRGGISVRF